MSRASHGTRRRAVSRRRSRRSGLGDLLLVVVGALVISALLRTFVGQMFLIPSGSMEDTLDIGDRVAVQKITDIHRGEVVVFADPGGWLGEETGKERGRAGTVLEFLGILPTSTGHLIKRVIGMPGDHVSCCDRSGRIVVNGQPLDERDYLFADADGHLVNPSDIRFDVIVPVDKIFVMGDHRDRSADSRCHLSDLALDQGKGQVAFVPMKDVVGRAFAIVWPWDRIRWLEVPPTYAQVPPPAGPPPAQAVIKTPGVRC